MLLDDRQAMLNDLLVAYRESSDHYADAAGQLDDPTLVEAFAEIRASGEEIAERLCEFVRAEGNLPRAAHIDREDARQLLTRLKGALTGDRRRIILEERIADEERIEALIGEALALEFPPDERNWIETLQTRQREVLVRLNGLLESV